MPAGSGTSLAGLDATGQPRCVSAECSTVRDHPRSATNPSPTRLGPFRIERMLGAGGMGDVYLATDNTLDRLFAIKLLRTDGARARARLIREAQAQASVRHPNVAHIYFIGRDLPLYFAMEYVDGETLAARVARGPLPIDEALDVIHGAALGLRAADLVKLTHRDVKPSNLMIDARGDVKVLDFGVVAGGPHHGDGPVAQTTICGTPQYMAPEQERGEAVDRRADIYALGATLYHLVAGKQPFAGDTREELAELHRDAPRPKLPPDVASRRKRGAVDRLCARMMAVNPAQRFASYDRLLHAIDMASPRRARVAGWLSRWCTGAIDAMLAWLAIGVIALVTTQVAALRDHDQWTVWLDVAGTALLALVGTAWWGRTPGQAMLGLEVVMVETGARPSRSQAARRTIAAYGPGLAGVIVAAFAGGWVLRTLAVVGAPLSLVVSSRFSSLGRAWWDRAAGTMVRYRH
jgi:hypothetical protein